MTPSSTEQFIVGLGLKGNKAEYFRLLVKFNQSDTAAEQTDLYQHLQRLTPHAHKRKLDEPVMEYLSHWLYPVLREMVRSPNFRMDPYWIQRRLVLQVPVKAIEKALSFLLKYQFIQKNADDSYEVSDDIVQSSDEVKSIAIRSYHQIILEQAAKIVDCVAMEERGYGALTLAIPASFTGELKDKVRDFRQSLLLWAEGLDKQQLETDHQVVQVNLQFYPQTKPSPPTKSD